MLLNMSQESDKKSERKSINTSQKSDDQLEVGMAKPSKMPDWILNDQSNEDDLPEADSTSVTVNLRDEARKKRAAWWCENLQVWHGKDPGVPTCCTNSFFLVIFFELVLFCISDVALIILGIYCQDAIYDVQNDQNDKPPNVPVVALIAGIAVGPPFVLAHVLWTIKIVFYEEDRSGACANRLWTVPVYMARFFVGVGCFAGANLLIIIVQIHSSSEMEVLKNTCNTTISVFELICLLTGLFPVQILGCVGACLLLQVIFRLIGVILSCGGRCFIFGELVDDDIQSKIYRCILEPEQNRCCLWFVGTCLERVCYSLARGTRNFYVQLITGKYGVDDKSDVVYSSYM